MFKREAGYDEENRDWFWAKYLPDGALDRNPAGIELAGRVAKGMDAGCIACHTALGGEDLETLHLAVGICRPGRLGAAAAWLSGERKTRQARPVRLATARS